MKRIVSVQDISCVGKCSLTVALPVLSAMGVEAAILPTAVLSNHTAFHGFTYCDLTDQMEPILRQWEREDIRFDAVYTGYLGKVAQVERMEQYFADQRKQGALIFVDPVMADNGKLYAGFDEAYVAANRRLCAGADVILPNITEACFLTGIPYQEEADEAYSRRLLEALAQLGTKQVVLTGVKQRAGRMGVMSLDSATGEVFAYDATHLPVSLHGTGDVFASTVLGALMRGRSLQEALRIAVDFTVTAIEKTMHDPEARWYGASFELAFPELLKSLE